MQWRTGSTSITRRSRSATDRRPCRCSTSWWIPFRRSRPRRWPICAARPPCRAQSSRSRRVAGSPRRRPSGCRRPLLHPPGSTSCVRRPWGTCRDPPFLTAESTWRRSIGPRARSRSCTSATGSWWSTRRSHLSGQYVHHAPSAAEQEGPEWLVVSLVTPGGAAGVTTSAGTAPAVLGRVVGVGSAEAVHLWNDASEPTRFLVVALTPTSARRRPFNRLWGRRRWVRGRTRPRR